MTKVEVEINPTLVFLLCLFLYLVAVLVIQPHLNNFILFYDYGDLLMRGGYYEQSVWVDTDLIPYKDYFVEYPPMGLYAYSLPRLFFNIYSQQDFLYAFIFLAIFPVLGIYYLIYKQTPLAVLFLCTPSFFYYSFARYDVFPAFFALWALVLILNNKQLWGAFILALAIGIKWYAVVLILPLLAVVDHKFKWLMVVCFSTVLFSLHNVFYAGIDGMLSSYTFHTGRVFNRESIYYLLHKYWWSEASLSWTKHIFLLLQLLPSFLVAFYLYIKKAKLNKTIVSLSAIITVLSFILFAKFHSPQWFVWLIPFVVLLGNRLILWVYIAVDIANYIVVPLVIRIAADISATFDAYNSVRAVLMILLLILSIQKLKKELDDPIPGK
jgi:hypothetical protein